MGSWISTNTSCECSREAGTVVNLQFTYLNNEIQECVNFEDWMEKCDEHLSVRTVWDSETWEIWNGMPKNSSEFYSGI